MKLFQDKRTGQVIGRTVTVGELKLLLNKYPDDMPVLAEWEGVDGYVPDDPLIKSVKKGLGVDACDCLVFWVEQY